MNKFHLIYIQRNYVYVYLKSNKGVDVQMTIYFIQTKSSISRGTD